MAEVPSPVLSAEQITRWRDRIRQTTLANYQFEMGVALLETGDTRAGRDYLQRALEIQPDLAAAAAMLADIPDSTAPAPAPAILLQGYRELALRALHHEKPAQAGHWLDRDLALAPDDGIAHAIAGMVAMQEQRYADAIAVLDRAASPSGNGTETDPATLALVEDVAAALGRYGRLARDWKRGRDATLASVAALQAGLRFDPANTEHPMLLVQYWARLALPDEGLQALAALPPAQAATPDMLITTAQFQLLRPDPAAALATLDARTDTGTVPGRGAAYRGLALLMAGDVDGALRECDRGRTLSPDHSFCQSCFGLVLHAAGRLDEALAVHRAALARNPQDLFWTGVNLGLALAAAGDAEQARSHYLNALRVSPWLSYTHVKQRPLGEAELTAAFTALGFPPL